MVDSISRVGLLAGVACASMVPSLAKAEVVTAFYGFPRVGISLDYFQFGYTNPSDEFVPLVGGTLLNTLARVSFTPDPGEDVQLLRIAMAIPVEPFDPGVSPFIEVLGTDLQPSPSGAFELEFSTKDYNGIIRAGRFSLEISGIDSAGEPVPLSGTFSDDSGFSFEVDFELPSNCAADFTADGFVDDSDFVIFAAAYQDFSVPPAAPEADLNGDGFVDDADFVEFAAAYDAFACP